MAELPARNGCRHRLHVCIWNVEGLTDLKLEQIALYMQENSLDIVCMQEVRKNKADSFELTSGHVVYWSGSADGGREWAGVGFVVAPHFKKYILGCSPFNNRVACLKLRVTRGCIALFTVLAPHNLKPLEERTEFYNTLDTMMGKVSVNGGRYVFGDLNARMGQRKAGEEDVLGDYCFGREAQHRVEMPNRDLLIEFCTA